MTVDIRATVTCSLGPVIDGGIGDDYAQGVGVIKTQGNILIDGIINPPAGTPVTISYTKDGVTRTIPRSLVVLSSFADPFRRTTAVELGCRLTYLSDLTEPVTLTGLDDPANTDLTEEDDRIVTIPVHASSVLQTCLAAIGIGGGAGLTNKFSIEKFDFSSGYVDIISNLLISENIVGFMSGSSGLLLDTISLGAVGGGIAPVITPEQIIDIGPIGVGQIPGDGVTVSYSTLKLGEKEIPIPDGEEDEAELAKLNWELEEVTGSETLIVVEAQFDDGREQIYNIKYIPKTIVRTIYDDWDRVITRVTTEYTVGAALNTQYMIDVTFAGRGDFAYGWGVLPQEIRDIEYFYYTVQVAYVEKPQADGTLEYQPATEKPENYSEVSSTKKIRIEPNMAMLQAIGVSTEVDGSIFFVSGDSIVEEVTTITKTGKKSIDKVNYPVTRTITIKRVAYGKTQGGQQDIAERKDRKDYGSLFTDALVLVDGGSEVRDFTAREAVLQSRPDSASRTDANNSADGGGDPNNGYRTESKSEIVLASGSAIAQRRTEFSLPYAPDDTFIKLADTYKSVPSDARQKAMAFGRSQNRLLLGNRYGMNIQLAPENVPPNPLSTFCIQISGVTATYLTNGTNWTFDASGIVCSIDALFWGAVGGTGSFWFPVAPGVTTLPETPPIVDGQITIDSLVLPYNEVAVYAAPVRLVSVISQFSYALELFTEVPALTLRTRLDFFDAVIFVASAGDLTVAGQSAVMVRRYGLISAGTSFVATGFSAGSIRSYVVGANVGTFDSTGSAANLLITRVFSGIEAGTFDLVGREVGLQTLIAISADLGEFIVDGQSAILGKNSTIESSAANYIVSGGDASLVANSVLTADGENFALSGQDAALVTIAELLADSGSFILTGGEADGIIVRRLASEVGGYSLAGQDANLQFSDYFSSWSSQTYGYQSLVYPDWWAD